MNQVRDTLSGKLKDAEERIEEGNIMSKKNIRALTIMDERFGHDTLISLATIDGTRPAVRIEQLNK